MSSQVAPSVSPPRLARAEQWVPGLRVLHTYQPAWLRQDTVAGLVLSALLVPQGMAYADLAGLPQFSGLYATVICLLAYAAFGPSPRWCWDRTRRFQAGARGLSRRSADHDDE
jgi:MFS superfamily sulfate permease-like transporter